MFVRFSSLLLSLTLLLSCGLPQPTPTVGPQGKDGSSGKNGDAGKDGKDGKPADNPKLVIAKTTCELKDVQIASSSTSFPKFDLLYKLLVLNDETVLVNLEQKHYFTAGEQANFDTDSSHYMKGDQGYDLAAAETTLWRAELQTSSSVKFTYKPSGLTKNVSCK